jgi:hypothetical protein
MRTIAVEIDNHKIEYVPILTNADPQYDYEYTINLFETYSLNRDKPARLILIPVYHVEYQRGRYNSGLFYSEQADSKLYPAEDMHRELWKRLHIMGEEEKKNADYKDQSRNRTVEHL